MWKHKRKPLSVRIRVAALMLLCWLLPLALLAGVNVYYLSSDQLDSRITKEVDRLKFSDENTIHSLETVVDASLEASYNPLLLKYYQEFQEGTMDTRQLLVNSIYFLRDNYSREETLDMALLWYREDPDTLYCQTYNTGVGTTYNDVRLYWEEDHDEILAVSATLGTRATFHLCDNRLYYVRNLCTDTYAPVATLVLRVNQEECFKAYSTFVSETAVTLKLDHCELNLTGDPVTEEETGMAKMGGLSGYTWSGGELKLYHDRQLKDFHFTALLRISDSSAFAPFHGYGGVLILMLLLLIPLMAVLMGVFHKHVSRPIANLMGGAKEIEDGHLGYQLTESPDSTEFQYLADSFNSMSERLEYQFRHIYEEELALRDARIKALQSQINPHFMNNTLEIINWEARLSGNDKVSRMIEALATLMNAGIDRKMRPEIPLSEEMIYVNSYLYITSQRLGDRLTILNEFPEEIMDCMVPRLILQPVIENAVEHGVARNGQGTVFMYGYKEGDYLYLEIMNESVMSQEDLDKVQKLLDPKYDTSREPALNLGIANVNQRLRILYGEDSGLSVVQSDPRHVTSRLKIRLKAQEPSS